MPLTDDPWLYYNSDGSVPAFRRAAPIGVFRFDGGSGLFAMPNVECTQIRIREGTDPGSASFRYNLTSGLDGAPISFEQALGTTSVGPYQVMAGDRLVVQGARPDGSVEALFDGLAVDFGMGLDPDLEEVIIGALGIGWTCWDSVIGGSIQRDAGAPRAGNDTQTALSSQFNPGGLPNCTPDGYMSGYQGGGSDFRYPTFLDPHVIVQPKDGRTFWTLNKALRYIIFNSNPTQTYVTNPDGQYLDALLVSPSTNGDTSSPITCPDMPISGKDWPGTVNRLVAEYGFGTGFYTASNGGIPSTSFNVFASQGGAIKSIYLAPRGSDFDPTTSNFNASGLHRDLSEVVNQQRVVGGLDRWEGSFVLGAGFPMASTDTNLFTMLSFSTNDPSFNAANRNKYRLFIFDECGEGHYLVGSSTQIASGLAQNAASSLDNLLGKGNYCQRRRPGIGTLISVDPITNRKYEARLAISTNYDTANTKGPGLWDGTGNWQVITGGSWRLLDDRLGIEITESNPNAWNIGQSTVSGAPFPQGTVNIVERLATMQTAAPWPSFWLRLTCVIEGDQCVTATAIPGINTPIARTISRVTDASDRTHNEYVDYPSDFNLTGIPLNPRNDLASALAEAQALRANTESGVLEGPVLIPRLTTYYLIGDRIGNIEGRNLGLRTDQGSGGPVYPVVVGITYTFAGDSQTTTLELSDAGTKRQRYMRPAPRRRPTSTWRRGDHSSGTASRNNTSTSDFATRNNILQYGDDGRDLGWEGATGPGGYVPSEGSPESPW